MLFRSIAEDTLDEAESALVVGAEFFALVNLSVIQLTFSDTQFVTLDQTLLSPLSKPLR